MPTLAGWITGEQVPQETIDQALRAMGEVLGRHGGQPARTTQPGAGLIAFSDTAYVMQRNDDPPVLDWVPDRRTLVYHRPLSGLHPLYYIENWPAQGNLLFASEINALFAVGVPRRLHLAALDTLSRYGFIPAPWTAFKDIYVVPAGSILRWQRAKIVVNHATDYHLDEALTRTNALDHLHALLEEATTNLLPPHEQLVALTGGGYSSAFTTALAAEHTSARFSIATIGYKKREVEWQAAEAVARECQRPFLAITGVDQPEFWLATIAGLEAPVVDTRPLALHQLLHTTVAETGARVAISALGAHILLGAMISNLALTGTKPENILPWYVRALRKRSRKGIAHLLSPDVARSLEPEERWEESLHARKLARKAAQLAGLEQKWYYLDLHLRLPDLVVHPVQQLATPERMAVRSPYLNSHVMDMLTRLPMLLDDETPKDSLAELLARRLLPDMTEIESELSFAASSGLSLVAPTESLLRIADSDLLMQTISADALRSTGIFDVQAVDALLKRKQNISARREVLLVFTTQLLCRLFETGL